MGATEYDAEVLADAPFIFWKMEGDNTDASGRALNASYVSGAWTGNGLVPGSSNSFSIGSYFYRSGDIGTISGGLVSIEFWIKWTSVSGSTLYGPMRYYSADTRPGVHFPGGNTGQIGFGNAAASGIRTIRTPRTNYNDGQLHHVVCVQDVDHMRIHVDGIEVVRAANTKGSGLYQNKTGIVSQSGVPPLPATYSRIAFYSSALTAERVKAHYAAALPGLLFPAVETDVALPIRPSQPVLGESFDVMTTMLDRGQQPAIIAGEPMAVPATMRDGRTQWRRAGTETFTVTGGMADGFVDLGNMLALEVLDPDLDRAPTAVTVVIVGAPAGAPLDFSIDGTLVYSTTADANGYLGPTSLAVTDDMLAGTHTIAVDSNGARGATATFTLKRDASPWPRVVGTDADPVLVPAAQTPSGIYKWVLQDLLPGGLGSFVMPYNPTTMTSPHFQRTLTPRTTTSVAAPAFHITEAAEEAISWEFSGYLDTQAAHDQLVAFGELNRRFYVIDHRNRAWVVTFTSVELTARKRQSRDDGTFNDWAHDYTVRALIYDQDWKVPQ